MAPVVMEPPVPLDTSPQREEEEPLGDQLEDEPLSPPVARGLGPPNQPMRLPDSIAEPPKPTQDVLHQTEQQQLESPLNPKNRRNAPRNRPDPRCGQRTTRSQTQTQSPTVMKSLGTLAHDDQHSKTIGCLQRYFEDDRDLNPEVMDSLIAFWARWIDSTVCKARATKDPDTFTWEQAMVHPMKEKFLKAADEEIAALVEQGTWHEVPKSEATRKIVPNHWVMKLKRSPDGELKRVKGRLVLRGDPQEYEGDTFSPVASWATVRAFLVISAVTKRTTCTIDFSNAFVQSPLPEDEPVWMHIPRGFKSDKGPEYCLKLVKSLYGHKRAPQLWFDHSSAAFRKLGLKQSKFDGIHTQETNTP